MAQIADHRDLLSTYRPGDLLASERIVRLYQNELLRAAFLLTASTDGSVLLARDTFLDFFRRLMRSDVPDDPRYGLLQSLSRSYLIDPAEIEQDNGDRPANALVGTISFEAERQRYQVGDERSRVLESLGLLDQETRLALVLRDFNALDEEAVCQILDETPFTLRDRLHPVRDRMLDSAGAGSGSSAREVLINAATGAPRPNLWPEVAGPLEDVFAEEDERRQRYTYAAAGAVALLLFIAGLWLFDVFPFGGGDERAAVAPTATPTAMPEPTVSPTPVPEISSFAIPQGDVPGRIMMGIGGIQTIQRVAETGFFDIESGAYAPYDELNQFGTPSPDGRYLIGLVTPERSLDQTTQALVALDSDTGDQVWKADLPDGSYTFVATLDRVYLTTRTATDDDETPKLLEFDLQSGELVAEHPNIMTGLLDDIARTIRIALHVSPDNERLFIALEEFGDGSTTMQSRTLASYALPDLTFESASVESNSTGVSQEPEEFTFAAAQVTPDGVYLYNVIQDTVQFRSSMLDEDLDRSLHFSTELNPGQRSDLRWITSNDGRYLYVVALSRNEAAVVDLLARRVVRTFPLDAAEGIEPIQQIQPAALGVGFGAGLTLSPDGRFLYMAGGIADEATSGNIERSVIWTIDLATWTAVDSWDVAGLVGGISYSNEQLILSTENAQETGQPDTQLVVIDPDSGDVVNTFGAEELPEWVDNFFAYALSKLYHLVHARAPAVDQAAFSDVQLESTLPRLTVLSSSEPVPAGSPVELAAQVLNPADGQQITEALPDVRFDPRSTVVIRLSHEDDAADEIILIASNTEPGEYLASSTLQETGYWNAEITITGEDGASWSQTVADVVQVVPSWEASDGNHYILGLEFDPDEPEIDEEVVVTARFFEVGSGEPLPEDEQMIEAFPDTLRVEFTSQQTGPTSAMLARNDEGIYEGVLSFAAAGVWEARIVGDGEWVQIDAGSVEVVR